MRTVIFVALAAWLIGFMLGATVLASGGETSISIGAGWNGNITGASIPWDDGGGVGAYFQLAHEWDVSERLSIVAQWVHLSQFDVGPPFNDTDEASVDHLGVSMKWTF